MRLKGYFNLDGWSNKIFVMNISLAAANANVIFCTEDGKEFFRKELTLQGGELRIINLTEEKQLVGNKGIIFIDSEKEIGCTMYMKEEGTEEGKFIEYKLPKVE